MTRDHLENISALADHETTPLNVTDLDQESLDWLTQINTLSLQFSGLEVPDPVDVEAVIADTIAEIEHDRLDMFIRFMTANRF